MRGIKPSYNFMKAEKSRLIITTESVNEIFNFPVTTFHYLNGNKKQVPLVLSSLYILTGDGFGHGLLHPAPTYFPIIFIVSNSLWLSFSHFRTTTQNAICVHRNALMNNARRK